MVMPGQTMRSASDLLCNSKNVRVPLSVVSRAINGEGRPKDCLIEDKDSLSTNSSLEAFVMLIELSRILETVASPGFCPRST